MPLILICGLPCSGKSAKADLILNHFKEKYCTELVRDEDEKFNFNRHELFLEPMREKEFRSLLKSEVERSLTKDKVIILDALNYIGGFRYELYCVSKCAKTSMCTVFCAATSSQCLTWNDERSGGDKYPPNVFDALVQRFEEPCPKNKWDSPLFIFAEGIEASLEDIENAIFSKKRIASHMSTQSMPLSSDNFLNQLNKLTKETVDAIIVAQKSSHLLISVPGSEEEISLSAQLTPVELYKMRRLFMDMIKSQPSRYHAENIVSLFVQYINST